MRKLLLVLLAVGMAAWAANLKLYLTDGSYQLVREYQAQGDRIRFYSVERSDWEEVPKELVDLKRTETEAAARQKELEKDAKMLSDEDRLARELQKEVMRIPQNPGVYWIDGAETKTIKEAESAVHTNKGRQVLKIFAPPGQAMNGTGTLELEGEHSANVISNPSQEFYIQLDETERFGIVKLRPKGNVRIVEDLTFTPTKEVVEEPLTVDVFQKEMTPDGLYKIWARDPLPDGEYAVVEFTAGQMNMQIWDFAIKAAKK